MEDENIASKAKEYAKLARKTWLEAKQVKDIEISKAIYQDALALLKSKDILSSSCDGCETILSHAEANGSLQLYKLVKDIQEKVALIQLQSNDPEKASLLLKSLGYVCRLSQAVLDYPLHGNKREHILKRKIPRIKTQITRESPCLVLDNFLKQQDHQKLASVFANIKSSYWQDHSYTIEPPSPYFSFVLPVDSLDDYGFIGYLSRQILENSLLQTKFPTLKKAKFVEIWAHNRPHASGHQMHFDSDDEGKNGIRNPIISTILYLNNDSTTENEKDLDVIMSGGPSLVTDQLMRDGHLAQRGYLSLPKQKRLVAFSGKVLHGVIPGKGVSPASTLQEDGTKNSKRRVTLMLAFWRKIKIRDESGPGSARPFPMGSNSPAWAKHLVEPVLNESMSDAANNDTLPFETSPFEIDCVYETLDGEPWTKKMGMPEYDQVYQGF